MAIPALPPDDLPSQELELSDRLLRRQLDSSLTQRFQRQCGSNILQLLDVCDWLITTTTNVVTLVIVCPDQATNWQVLNYVVELGDKLAQFSKDAKLRIYPTPEMLDQFEIRVDELSMYRERS